MGDFEESESGGRTQSEFNSAVSYLNRINYIFTVCDEMSMSLDVNGWFHMLLCLYRELSTMMKKPEMDAVDKMISELNPRIGEFNDEQRRGNTDVDINFYNQMHRFELYLRSIYKETGLQMKMSDDASKALR